MELSKASNSKLRNVYGLPTLRGVLLFGILWEALYFSISKSSSVEQWLFLLMILLVLVHLAEISLPFRTLEIRILPFDPPFQGEKFQVPIQVNNLTKTLLENISLRFEDQNKWNDLQPVPANSMITAFIAHAFPESGKQKLPRITVRTIPSPGFFRFWKRFQLHEITFVLPKPVDHLVAATPHARAKDEEELASIEPIYDPRDLPRSDPKLFLKTGNHYRRIHRSTHSEEPVDLNWAKLEHLGIRERGEQFSHWIKLFSAMPAPSLNVSVNAPFLPNDRTHRSVNWRNLKSLFAKWFYAQS